MSMIIYLCNNCQPHSSAIPGFRRAPGVCISCNRQRSTHGFCALCSACSKSQKRCENCGAVMTGGPGLKGTVVDQDGYIIGAQG